MLICGEWHILTHFDPLNLKITVPKPNFAFFTPNLHNLKMADFKVIFCIFLFTVALTVFNLSHLGKFSILDLLKSIKLCDGSPDLHKIKMADFNDDVTILIKLRCKYGR